MQNNIEYNIIKRVNDAQVLKKNEINELKCQIQMKTK